MSEIKIYTQLEIVKTVHGLFFNYSNNIHDLKRNEKPSNMVSDNVFSNIVEEIDNLFYNLNEHYLEEELTKATIKLIRYSFVYGNSKTVSEFALSEETYNKLMNLEPRHEYMDELVELLSEFGFDPKEENYFKCILLDEQEN